MAIEKIETIIEEMKTSLKERLDACDGQNTELRSEIEALQKQVTDLEAGIKERPSGLLPGLEDEVKNRKPSWVRILKGLRWNDWGDGYEKRILQEATERYHSVVGRYPGEAKAASTELDASGGYLVPSELMTDLIEKLDERAVTLQAGARILPGMTSSPVQWPKITGGAKAYWEGETEAITDSTMTVGMLSLVPHRLGAMSIFPERLIRLASQPVEQIIEADFAKRLALKLDQGVLIGDGAGVAPVVGIANLASVNDHTIDTNGGLLDFDEVVDMAGLVEDSYADVEDPSAAWISNRVVWRLLRKTRVAADSGDVAPYNGPYVVPPIMSEARLRDMLGYPFFGTNQLVKTLTKGTSSALTYAFFGVWSEVLIPQWYGMTVRASTETSNAFAKSQVYIKAELEVDVGVRHDESFAKCDEVATTNPVS